MAILNPSQSNTDRVINCLGDALGQLGIDPRCKDTVSKAKDVHVFVGGGTDGASVNVGVRNGMKAQMQATLSWLFWTWVSPTNSSSPARMLRAVRKCSRGLLSPISQTAHSPYALIKLW